jgi:hypothetical protein
VYRIAAECSILTLFPAALLNTFMRSKGLFLEVLGSVI